MLGRLEEIKLIAQCAAADNRRAFGKLVEVYQDSLRRYLYSLTDGDAALTDDLAQDTFIKAYESIRSFKCLSGFGTWIYRIAYNEYISWKRTCHPMVDESYIPENSSVKGQISADIRHDIGVALNSLPDIERSLVLLFYLEDKKIKEIVKITGLPEGTVKVYLSRARQKMFNQLNEL